MIDTISFQLGIIVGLQTASVMLVLWFTFYAVRARRRIRQWLNDYEAQERKKRGL